MSPADRPFVSIIVPCRNEEGYVGKCLESILGSDYPQERLEVLVVDGASDDRTREIVKRYAERHPAIRLLDNPKRVTPAALNIAIGAAQGQIVLRMGAHVAYPPRYTPASVAPLQENGPDTVA